MMVLDGLRVIDFGQYLAGPMVAMMLGDHGAEVIRVDPPDGVRWRTSANAVLQRGKTAIRLDFARNADFDAARRLITGADVVIENFRPGVMARCGLGAAEMTTLNPQLVYCSLPGFGHTDPRADQPGWEGIVNAATGLVAPSVREPGTALPRDRRVRGDEGGRAHVRREVSREPGRRVLGHGGIGGNRRMVRAGYQEQLGVLSSRIEEMLRVRPGDVVVVQTVDEQDGRSRATHGSHRTGIVGIEATSSPREIDGSVHEAPREHRHVVGYDVAQARE